MSLDQASRYVKDHALCQYGSDGQTALHVLSSYPYAEGLGNIAKAIFLEDAKLYQQIDKQGRTCFHIAAEAGSWEWVQFYSDRKISDDEVTNSRLSLLHSVCIGEPTDALIARFIKQHRRTDQLGQTPLHLLVQNKKINEVELSRCVKRLIDGGASIRAKDSGGLLPLHMAMSEQRVFLYDMLDPKDFDYKNLSQSVVGAVNVEWCLKHHKGDPFDTAMQHSLDHAASTLYTGKEVSSEVFVEAVQKGMKQLTLALLETGHQSNFAYHAAAKQGWVDILKRMENDRVKSYSEYFWSFVWKAAPPWDVSDSEGKKPLDYAADAATRDYLMQLGCTEEDDWVMIEG